MTSMRHLLAGTGLAAALALMPASVQAQDVITLGAAVSLTGKYSTNGKNTKDGYDLAVKTINEKGGVKVGDKTYQLEIKYYDDESTPARGAELLERLINQDGVKFVLGPYSSGMTKAMVPVTEQHKIPMVQANGAARELFTKGYRYHFAVLSTSDKYLSTAIDLAAENAQKLGKEAEALTVAIIVENDPFSQDVRAGILDDAKRYNMQVVMDDQFPKELNDISASLTKVKALKPDILVISGHAKGAATAVQQIDAMKVHAPVIALTHCDSAQVAEKFGKAAEYILCAQQWDVSLTYKDELFGDSKNYAKLFKEAYDYDPPYQAAESTAAVEVYADAFERAGTLDTEKVRDALAATDMETFYGPIKFDETGKNTAKPMVLTQVQKGEYVLVAPSKWAAAEATLPAPGWAER
jgi:branched-chain amino acid transport system substrate-binding protein